MKQSFNEIKKIAYETDTNCCTVISASVVFEKDYQETHAFFKARGRKNGKGIGWQELDKVYKELGELEGFNVTLYNKQYLGKGWAFVDDESNALCMMKTKGAITINNFRDYLPKGDYVLGVYRHVVGVKNGAIQDWTANKQRNRRQGTARSSVFEIWKMEKKGKKVFKDLKKSKYDFSKFI